MLGLGRDKGLVGVDIGSYSIKAVELKGKKKEGELQYEVRKIGYELLPHDAIVEGTIIDSAAVVETIKMVFDENKITNRNVVISISGNSVIIKKIALPAMETEELAESIIWEAKHNIPYPYDETNVDYAILKPAPHSEEKNLDILLVAAKKDKIANYSNVINQARKNLEAIEVPLGALDITLYRDDFSDLEAQHVVKTTEISFSVKNKDILLVDDVLFTGRTIRAALDEIVDFGRPKRVELLVLVDRGYRELPIRADFVGKNIPTAKSEMVEVRLKEVDDSDEVVIVEVMS